MEIVCTEAPTQPLSSLPGKIHMVALLALSALTACSTMTSSLTNENGDTPTSERALKSSFERDVTSIVGLMQTEIGLNMELRSLSKIEEYIKAQFRKRGQEVDVHVELYGRGPAQLGEGGALFAIIVGNKKTRLSTTIIVQPESTEFAQQLRKNITTKFFEEIQSSFEKYLHFVMAHGELSGMEKTILLSLFWEKYTKLFKQHGLTLIDTSMVIDETGATLMLEVIDLGTGSKIHIPLPLKIPEIENLEEVEHEERSELLV